MSGLLVVLFFCNFGFSQQVENQLKLGQQIYASKCANCHGNNGQGVAEKYDDPLQGDASLGELVELIHDTMPEENPDACVDQEAKAVATFIHKKFYAKSRIELPKKRLARLTANQLRQSLSDIYGRMHGPLRVYKTGGLKGEYFAKGNYRSRKFDRVDSAIEFDFGNDGPGKGISPKEFSISWRGSIIPFETGKYEIVADSSCSFTCEFINDHELFFNNHVQSESKTEFRRSVRLQAGRPYPIYIRFAQRKRKTKLPPANFSLKWVPPGGVEQVIPAINMSPENAPHTFALQTELPPDDRSYGYERGINVSREWDASTTKAAIEFSQVVAEQLWPRFKRSKKKSKPRDALREFLTSFVRTAFRSPIDEPIEKLYIDSQIEKIEDDSEAVRRVVLIALKSPRFLYPTLANQKSSASQFAANQLAYTLFDSLPSDQWLLKQAEQNNFEKENQIRAAAQRMVNDHRCYGKVQQLMSEWMNLGHIGELEKDEKVFPEFDAELVTDLKLSLHAFVSEVIQSESSDYRQLFTANWNYTTPRIAKFYGEAWKTEKENVGLQKASNELHTGVISHPYLMSGLAYNSTSSPIHRGVFLIRYMLGRTLRPPNEAFTPLSPDLHPDLTTRQRVELQTNEKNCLVCHAKINGLGFTLENFDAVGRYRLKEKKHDINAAGKYTTRNDQQINIKGHRELAKFLVKSDDAHRAFVNRVFQHFVKQPPAAFGESTLDDLVEKFKKEQFHIRKLLVEVAVIAATPNKNEIAKK